jgi:Holliday junction resolvase RusA-like endonuclease
MRSFAAFEVVGVEPAPQGSKRYLGNGRFIEASKKLEPWRNAVAQAVHQMFADTGDSTPFTEACQVEVTFILPKPKTVKRDRPTVPPDCDKLQRSLGDSISLPRFAVLLEDDSLICRWDARKVYGTTETMGCKVVISLLPQDTLDS